MPLVAIETLDDLVYAVAAWATCFFGLCLIVVELWRRRRAAVVAAKQHDSADSGADLRCSFEYTTRVVAAVHPFFSVGLGVLALRQDESATWGEAATPLQRSVAAFELGYFIADACAIVVGGWDAMFFCHHGFSLLALSVPALLGANGYEGMIVLVLMELPNSFGHARWLLIAERRTATALFRWVTRVWFAVYWATRVLYGPVLCWHLVAVAPGWMAVPLVVFFGLSAKFGVDVALLQRRGVVWK